MMRLLDRPAALVARREIAEGTRAKSFRILLAISILAVAGLVVIIDLVGTSEEIVIDVAVVGQIDPTEAARFATVGDAIGARVDVVAVSGDGAARQMVEAGTADVAVLEDARGIEVHKALDASTDSSLAMLVNVLRSDLALEQGLEEAGLSPEEIAAALAHEPPALEVLDETAEDEDSGVGLAVVMNIALFLLLQSYGSWVISGITREKSSRVVEVLLSTVTVRQLMFGKLIGIGLVALLHATALVVTSVIAAAAVGIDVPGGFRASQLVIGVVWFMLGYALYCGAFAAAGSLCSRSEDAQGAVLPITLPLLAGYIVGLGAAADPGAGLWVMAFLPPTAALTMPVLSATVGVPLWAMLASMALTALAAYGTALLTAAIYSRSILNTGKRVRWRDALRREPRGTAGATS